MSNFGLVGWLELYRGRGREKSGTPGKGSLIGSRGSLPVDRPTISGGGLVTLPKPSLQAVQAGPGTPGKVSLPVSRGSLPVDRPAISGGGPVTLPKTSLQAVASGRTKPRERNSREASAPPSKVLPMRPRTPAQGLPEGASLLLQSRPDSGLPETGSHVPAFVQQRLQKATGKSVSHEELRAAYEAWCTIQGYQPVSIPKFAAELKALGFEKWKSSGLIRYRNLELVVLPPDTEQKGVQ